MLIIPAIDIMNKKCVRLVQGDFNNFKVYYDNPLIPAKIYKEAGIKLLHIVDLDGARDGEMRNLDIIKKINEIIDIEVGGGIRNLESIKLLVNSKINRIILGTRVIEDRRFLDSISNYIDKIVIGIDLKDGKISTKGWIEQVNIDINEFILFLQKKGIKEIIVTDIKKDGMLSGVDIDFYKNLSESFPDINIIVSGGISSMKDIEKIKELKKDNIKGVIVGKALYEGNITLDEIKEFNSREK